MIRETQRLLETSLDHLSGEEVGAALSALSAMPEVLDAIYLTGVGKKNRPCGLLQVICRPEDEETVLAAIFRHTHTLGVRTREAERVILPRRAARARVGRDVVRAKAYEIEGEGYLRPEADEIARLAARDGLGAPAYRLRPPSPRPARLRRARRANSRILRGHSPKGRP